MNYMDKMSTTRKGLILLIAGLLIMVLGFILLSGGGSDDPAVFNYEMFNFRRLVAAPVVMVAGIAVIVYAIIRKPGKEE